MVHPVEVCGEASKRYFALCMAGHEAALKDPEYQKQRSLYFHHVETCPMCRAELEKDGIVLQKTEVQTLKVLGEEPTHEPV